LSATTEIETIFASFIFKKEKWTGKQTLKMTMMDVSAVELAFFFFFTYNYDLTRSIIIAIITILSFTDK
jgi:hypothetical protein